MTDELKPTSDAVQMRNLLVRMLNGGVAEWWRDAIVRVLDGGAAPENFPDDFDAIDRRR